MRFVCDSCHAQYMISDDKVGASGVKVRCKKCGHVIVVRRQGDPASQETDAALRGLQEMSAPPPPPVEAPTGESSIFSGVDDEEIGAAFESALGERPEVPPPTADQESSSQETDGESLARLAALAEGNVPAATDAPPPTAHDWYVAIDDKQTGPLTPDAIKQHWDRGEIGPDSLTWRQGLEDWVPLSEVVELASWLVPRPTRPVFTPSGTGPVPGQVVTVPVESAFTAGGVVRTVRTEVPTPVPETGGWRPSASAALASLVKEEIDALTKPEPPPPAPEPAPAARGLLEVPPAAAADAPAAPTNGRQGRAEAPTPVTPVERPAFAPAYPYVTRPARASRKGLLIGLGVGGVVLAGLVAAVGYLFLRTEKAAQVAVAPPAPVVEAPKPSQPAPAPAPASAPPAASAATPPVPPVARVTPAVPAVETPTSPHRGGKRGGTRSSGNGRSGGEEVASASEPRSSGGSRSKADDLFDEVFGSGGGEKRSPEGSKSKRSAYVPPEPGSSSTEVPDRLPKGDIMSVVLANKPSIVRCVNEQKSRDPNLHGTLVVHWTIQTSGRTTGVQPVTEPFKSSYMATCLTGLVKSWTFPKHKYQPGEPVDFPFTF